MGLTIRTHSISYLPQTHYLDALIAGEQLKKEQIVLVPEHIKFNAEKEIIKNLSKRPISSSFYTKVFSISRFLWSLLQGNTILDKILPTNSVEHILMAQALLIVEDNLTVFKGQIHFQEFINLCLDLYHEFEAGQIDFENLNWSESRPDLVFLKDKIHDLELIFKTFEQLRPTQLSDQEILYQTAKKELNQLSENKQLPQVIYVSHFFRFSALEQDLLLTLSQYTDVFIYLPLVIDEPAKQIIPDLFNGYWPSVNTLNLLKKDYRNYAIDLKIETIENQPNYLADNWLRSFSNLNNQSDQYSNHLEIHLSSSDSYEKEWINVINQINQLVFDGEYRYQDIIIMTRNLERYKKFALQTIEQRTMPIFIDEQELMDHHPLYEMVLSLEQMIQPYWTSQDFIRFLRNERCLPPHFKNWSLEKWRQFIDEVETLVLALGIDQRFPLTVTNFKKEEILRQIFRTKSDVWLDEFENNYYHLMSDIDQMRIEFQSINELDEMVHAFYNWLITYQVNECSNYWRRQALEQADIELSQHEEQAWQVLIDILDELMTYHTTSQLNAMSFFDLIKVAFETNHYQLVPSRVDQVTLTSIDAVQFNQLPIVFIIGLDQSSLPRMGQSISLLDNRERENLSQQIKSNHASTPRFKPLKKESIATEPFIFARALSVASKHLFLSYTTNDENNLPILKSPYLDQFIQLFELEETKQPNVLYQEEDVYRLFIDKPHLMSKINWQKTKAKAKKELIETLTWTNLPLSIGRHLAEALYGKDLYLSVSRLENYYKDPYNYFLNYGLKIKEREVFEITQLEKGTLFHDVMEKVWNNINHTYNNDWSLVTLENLNELIHAQLSSRHPILEMYDKTQYLQRVKDRLFLNLNHLFHYILETQQQLIFHESYTEQTFEGHSAKDTRNLMIPNLQYKVPVNGEQRLIQVRGRIDRLEIFQLNHHPYGIITDYKSGNKDIAIRDIINGTNLQVMTYLNAIHQVQINGHAIQPLGALYQSLKLTLVDQSKAISKEGTVNRNEIGRLMRPKGFMLQNIDVLNALYRDPENVDSSILFPYKLKKGWEKFEDQAELEQELAFNKTISNILTTKQFFLLMEYTEWLIKKAAKDILSGELKLAPLADTPYIDTIKDGKYHGITWFDPLFKNNRYRLKETRSDRQKIILLNEIEEEMKGG